MLSTRDKGLILRPNLAKGFDVFVDADFTGNWNFSDAPFDRDTAKSRTGYVILFAGCPITWQSKLQTEIALSTTEAEYIALSQALRTTIPLMRVVKEMSEQGIGIHSSTPEVHCEVFEDNSGAIELATNNKIRPRTRHINVKYHHFRHYVESGAITIKPIASADNAADFLTKPLPHESFSKHRETIQGWVSVIQVGREREYDVIQDSAGHPVLPEPDTAQLGEATITHTSHLSIYQGKLAKLASSNASNATQHCHKSPKRIRFTSVELEPN